MSDIQYVYPLIHNKVTSPHYVTPTLRRARLLEWLHGNATCRAIVIAADAGYGKTTLLWQWEQEAKFPCYWYKLDRNDRDWSLHISYLIEAISQRHAGFGRRAHSMLQQLGGPGSSRPGVAAYLLAEMYERLTEPCTFIIDDWQFVASVTEVRGLWNQILRDAPPTCRFVFLSRAKPQLQFARFKTHGGYAEMRTDALRFTDREIDELFRDIYNDPLDPTELAELERRTEGWAASLQLVEVSLRERKSAEDRREFIQSITATTDSDLVEFLAEEVLDQQNEAIRNFLLSTSILQQIEPELAARLAGVPDGARILADLELRGLFAFRLDASEALYRYHGLFRSFLERRLQSERSPGEVVSLHIHAASYYETHAQWPGAIHHYLEADLKPQAARLLAKHGEDVVSVGRIALLDGWLHQLPGKTVRDNARLSLLSGETAGIRGEWDEAMGALQRARTFFARKGDRRMEALACLKLSSVRNNRGDVAGSAKTALEGLALAPDDATATRLRLRGNIAVTATWLRSLEDAEHECMRVAVESHAAGFEQFAAIAYHNLGLMLRYAGRLEESRAHLERAARYWDASPTNPFADNSELVMTLLLLGDTDRAKFVADAAVARTQPWARPHGDAKYGRALVLANQGHLAEAAGQLRSLLATQHDSLGPVLEKAAALLIECLYLMGASPREMESARRELEGGTRDPRLAPTTSVAIALASHRLGDCTNQCDAATIVLDDWERNGGHLVALVGKLRLALLAFEHEAVRAASSAASAIEEVLAAGVGQAEGWWLRCFAPHLAPVARASRTGHTFAGLIHQDPEFWTPHITAILPTAGNVARGAVLKAVAETASVKTAEVLSSVDGADVAEMRKELTQRFADHIYIRSIGAIGIHRGGWFGPSLGIGRKRIRLLLGLLAMHLDGGLTRDMVLDFLWPDASPSAAVNSLNQTVFQLRRLIDREYREGESPQYVLSNLETVQLNTEIVSVDLAVVRDLARQLPRSTSYSDRREIVARLLDFVRGEYMADLKYEEWVSRAQFSVHAELREILMPIAAGEVTGLDRTSAIRAGAALVSLDPFDEMAHLSVARHMAESGQRTEGREVLIRLAARLRDELDESPSDDVRIAAAALGADLG